MSRRGTEATWLLAASIALGCSDADPGAVATAPRATVEVEDGRGAGAPGRSDPEPERAARPPPDDIASTVENHAPVAALHAPDEVPVGAAVRLDASGSSDPDGGGLRFGWTQTGGPAVDLGAAGGPVVEIVAPPHGAEIELEVTVTDGQQHASATRRIRVVNRAPRAWLVAPREIESGAGVVLDASASADPDGQALTYAWTQTAGPRVELGGAGAVVAFTAPIQRAELGFRLVVSDGELTSERVEATLSVRNHAPEARASGPEGSVAAGSVVRLDASRSSDVDGDPLSFQWVQTEGPPVALDDPRSSTPSYTAPGRRARIGWRVDVSDGFTDASAGVQTQVKNQPPAAVARAAAEVSAGDSLALDGTGSSDLDGDHLAFRWRQTGGPDARLVDPTAPRPHITVPSGPTELVFELVVHDGFVASAASEVRLSVDNRRPVARAGWDLSARAMSQVVLSGAGSTDPEGAPLSYAWRQVGGADGQPERPHLAEPVVHRAGVPRPARLRTHGARPLRGLRAGCGRRARRQRAAGGPRR